MKYRFLSLVFCCLAALSFDLLAQSDTVYSGSWYNPARDGEGFHVEILDNGQALVIWFTYPGSSSEAESRQFWILGVGSWSDGVITINDAYQASGPVFGPSYDKDAFERTTWGSLKITFTGPDSGRVEYDGLSGQGSTEVVRLTNLMSSGTPSSLPAEISAAWYDPQTDGQGWFVEVLNASAALVYWFTYDENGNPAWNLGVGTIFGNQIVVQDSRAGTGTRFGDGFQSSDINLDPFTMMILEFTDCNAGSVRYLNFGGVVTGSFPITRLTILDGFPCAGFSSTRLEQELATNGSDPLISQYLGLDSTAVRLFGKKDGNGRAARLQSGLVETGNGQTISFSLDSLGGLAFIQDSLSNITLSAGMDAIGNSQVVLNDEENGVSSSVPTGQPDALLSAVEQSGGRNEKMPPSGRIESFEGGSAQVAVELCGETASNAQVSFVLSSGGNETVLPADQTAPGVYQSALPTSLGPPTDEATATENCELTGSQFGTLCAFLGDETGSTGLTADDCLSMGQQMGVARPESAMLAASACATFRASITSACMASQDRAGNCNASSVALFREFSDFDLSVRVSIPGLTGTSISEAVRYDVPGTNVVFPNVSVTGSPYYKAHAVNPARPGAGDTYRLDVLVGCVGAGQTLTVDNLTTGSTDTCVVDDTGYCRTDIASRSGDSSHVLEVSAPSGTIQRVVQKLEPDENPGSGDGFWKWDFVEDDGFRVRAALGVNHPTMFLCDYSYPDDRDQLYLQWDNGLGYYVGPVEEGIFLGVKVETGQICYRFYAASNFDVLESACIADGFSQVSTWSEATAGDGGYCPNFP